MTTFHDILGTTKASTTQEIKKRYKLLSAKCHPDKGGTGALFKLVKLAFDRITEGYGDDIYSKHDENDASLEKQLRAQVSQIQDELSRELQAKDLLNEELKESKRKSDTLEVELQQQSYKLAALEKHNNSKPYTTYSSNRMMTFSIIIMAILTSVAGYTLSERLHKNTPAYKAVPPQSISNSNADKKLTYKLLLMSLQNDKNSIAVAQDLRKRGYQVFVEPYSNYYNVIVSVSTSDKQEVATIIDALKSITGSQARILNSGVTH